MWFSGNLICLARLLNTKSNDKKPVGAECLFFWLKAHTVGSANNKKGKFKPVTESVIHWLPSVYLVENKLALLYPWYSAQMCHLPRGFAERVGSVYNDPKERGIWGRTMRRMDCGCCVGSAEMTDVAWEKELGRFWETAANIEEIKKRRRRRRGRERRGKLSSSWSHLSVWQKYDSAVWKGGTLEHWFEMFHRPRFSPVLRTGYKKNHSPRRLYLSFFRKKKNLEIGLD